MNYVDNLGLTKLIPGSGGRGLILNLVPLIFLRRRELSQDLIWWQKQHHAWEKTDLRVKHRHMNTHTLTCDVELGGVQLLQQMVQFTQTSSQQRGGGEGWRRVCRARRARFTHCAVRNTWHRLGNILSLMRSLHPGHSVVNHWRLLNFVHSDMSHVAAEHSHLSRTII